MTITQDAHGKGKEKLTLIVPGNQFKIKQVKIQFDTEAPSFYVCKCAECQPGDTLMAGSPSQKLWNKGIVYFLKEWGTGDRKVT